MKYNIDEIDAGDIVTVKSGFSDGPIEVGTVVARIVKNDRHVVVYSISGEEKWCYVEQIVQIDTAAYYASKS